MDKINRLIKKQNQDNNNKNKGLMQIIYKLRLIMVKKMVMNMMVKIKKK